MNKLIGLIISLSFSIFSFGQNGLNMELLSSFDPTSDGFNDVWGYVDEEGNEYALVGTKDSIYILDVTLCNDPQLIYGFDGTSYTWWRDYKVYNDYAYAVCDACNEGLHVFDLSALPDGPVVHVGTFTTDLTQAHNIFVDAENDRLYAIDTYHPNFGDRDVIIYDLSTTPENPAAIYSGYLGGGGIHDANVKNNRIFTSHYYGDKFEVYDVTDVNNITLLESLGGLDGAHATWNDEQEQYAYMVEEKSNHSIKIIDLANLEDPFNDIEILPQTLWDPLENNASGLIAHNPFVLNDYLYVSHYEDGVKVYDISSRATPSLAAYLDIYPQNDNLGYNGFYGTWGIYPYLPSGCILASDDTNGLNMMQLDWSISDTCTPILDINGTIGDGVYSASNFLYSDGAVPLNGMVSFQAEIMVELKPGFESDAKVDFEAIITPCTPNN